MIKRLLPITVVVLALITAIAYSKYRPPSDHVSGFVEADEIRLGSRVGGRVAEVLVEEGQQVKAGDVLVKLEPFNLVEQQKQAAATLAAREADFRRLKAGLREEEIGQAKARYEQLQARLDRLVAGPREQEIEAARANVRVADAQQKLASESYNRIKRLADTNAVTREDLDRAVEALDSAQGAQAARQEDLKLLEAGTRKEEIRETQAMVDEARLAWELAKKGYRQEDVDQAEASRDAARAALDAINQSIEELSIHSPIDGVIEALDLRKGDLATAGGPVLSILDAGHIWVRAYVPENRMDLKPGQEVFVTSDSFPGKRFAATLSFISRQAEFTPSNVQTPEERAKQVFRIKATLKEGLDELRPGTPADVWLGGGK